MIQSHTLCPADRFAIKDLFAAYAWALDTGNVDAFVACFTPDGALIEEVFEDPDVWAGHANLRRLAEHYRSVPNFPGRQHHVANVLFEGGGERCRARSFALVTECRGEPPFSLRFTGYYEDELVKYEGNWLIEKRVVRLWDGEVLKRFPGHGAWVPRRRPPELRIVGAR